MKTNLSAGLMFAASAEALAEKYNCLQSRSADKKILGPSYRLTMHTRQPRRYHVINNQASCNCTRD